MCVIVLGFFFPANTGWVYFPGQQHKNLLYVCCTDTKIQHKRHVFKASSLKTRQWSRVHSEGRRHGWSGWAHRDDQRGTAYEKLMASHGEAFETGCVFKVDVLTQLIDKSLPVREEKNRSKVFEQKQDGASFQHWCQIKTRSREYGDQAKGIQRQSEGIQGLKMAEPSLT